MNEAQTYLPEIEGNLDRVQRSGISQEALEEIYRRAHTIAGSAAMMELPDIAAVARAMEDLIDRVLEGAAPFNDPVVGVLRRTVGRLRRLLDLARTGASDASLVGQNQSEYAALVSGGAPPRTGSIDPRAASQSSPFSAMPPPHTGSIDPRAASQSSPFSATTTPPPLTFAPTAPIVPSAAMPPAQTAAAMVRLAETPLWRDVVVEADSVNAAAATIKQSLATLRDIIRRMEGERSELLTFLDSSQDALERLEAWAGQAMGVDLRTSPEHVRSFLPLSVLWVVTARLKHVMDLLQDASRGLVVRQEGLDETIDQLRDALERAGQIASGAIGAASLSPDGGVAAQVTQFSYAPPAQSRATDLPAATRAEIERAVREDLRRDLEDEVRAEIAAQVRREEEQRLIHELRRDIRREMLGELQQQVDGAGRSQVMDLAAGAVAPLAPAAPRRVTIDPAQVPRRSRSSAPRPRSICVPSPTAWPRWKRIPRMSKRFAPFAGRCIRSRARRASRAFTPSRSWRISAKICWIASTRDR